MAAKSITIPADAAFVLDALDRYLAGEGGVAERSALQNGTRVKLRGNAFSLALNLYPSKTGGCKIVFDQADAPQADTIAALLSASPSKVKASKSAGTEIAPVLDDAECWVGSDESGKGDYFGPLVAAAVALTTQNWRVLEALGVQDSKNLTDPRALALAPQIVRAFPNEVIVIMPKRYNELWTKFGSVNRLLAWAHARAIENVIERAPGASAAVADQFGDESLIRNALFERGREVRLVQMHRAERDPAVAAASILARAEFLRRLDQLGRTVGTRLPKGASSQVEAVGRAVVSSRGPAILDEIAKRHFKTTQRVV